MGNFFFTNFNLWNRNSIDHLMMILIFKFDIYEHFRTKKYIPITLEEYKHLQNQMEMFLNWYKKNKPNCYKPENGILPMYSYNKIKKCFLMIKYNKNIINTIKKWKKFNKNINLSIIDEIPQFKKSELPINTSFFIYFSKYFFY